MSGVNNPPPVPSNDYFVAIDGKSTGPFSISKLKEMIASGKLSATSLVWKEGMKDWVAAETIEELKGLFMPPIPPNN
jgi:hypothetical protein